MSWFMSWWLKAVLLVSSEGSSTWSREVEVEVEIRVRARVKLRSGSCLEGIIYVLMGGHIPQP